MKNYNQTSRILRKKKIFECYLSIHKSLGNVIITNSNKDKLNQKYELLNQKIHSKHQKEILSDKNYLKQKRLNNIFSHSNLCTSQNDENINLLNIPKNQKSKFAEKYKELYNITTNSNNKIVKRVKNNSINYYSNKLKSMNYINDLTEETTIDNLYDKNYLLKQSYKDLKNGIITKKGYNSKNNNYRNSCLNNLAKNINHKTNNNCIRKKIFNKIDDIKNVIKSIDKIDTKIETKYNNILLNNYINNPNNSKKNIVTSREKYNKNNKIYNSFKSKSSIPSQDTNRNYSNLRKNVFTNNNLNIFGLEENEKIIHKINHFKARLNLLSMK